MNGQKLYAAVALMADVPAAKLLCGQVATVVASLPAGRLLVEFADDAGRAYAISPITKYPVIDVALWTRSGMRR